jgi:hypothetical protein
MITTQPCEFDNDVMVCNILRVYRSATPDQMAKGAEWYRVAHGLALMIADGDAKVGAGLLAALSPQTAWWLNIELAADAYETGRPRRHVSDALDKASKILAGIDPEDVLPMERKTGHFYRCILDPADDWTVCVDRHAHDIAVGQPYGSDDRGLSTTSRYNKIADAYRHAAREVGILPQQLQAITWVAWTEQIAGTSTRGARREV